MDDDEFVCVGIDGLSECKYRPVYVVHGDLACAYHLQSMVKLRLDEVGAAITIEHAVNPREVSE